jgi:hypothetical protein
MGNPAPPPNPAQFGNYPPSIGVDLYQYQTQTTHKEPVRLATGASVANLGSITVANFDGAGQGVTLVQGDRVLVRHNSSLDGVESTNAKRMGIWVVGVVTSGTAALTRDTDANTSAMVTSGMTTRVMEGTYAGQSFGLTTANPITLDTTALAFAAPLSASVNGISIPASPAAASTLVATSATTTAWVPEVSYGVRGVVTANVSSLSAFTVASADGPTYTAGQTVLLVGQSTASQNGPYIVGTVTTGTAPLTRPAWWATGMVVNGGSTFVASEGTSALGTLWMLTTAAPITVDTTSVTIACVISQPTVEPSVYKARAVVASNIASLAAFTVAGNDGVTLIQGDIVLLVSQTTTSQNGPYVVGPVTTGSAALSRPVWWQTGTTQPGGQLITLSGEGTHWKNSTWKACVAASTLVVDTTDPAFYPQFDFVTTTAFSAGVSPTQTGLWVLSGLAGPTNITATPVTPGGTAGILRISTQTAGKGGSSSVICTSSSGSDTTTAKLVVQNF